MSRVVPFLLVCSMIHLHPLAAGDTTGIRPIVLEQFAKYPAMQIDDFYKLVYQSAMGNEHAMTDTAGARAYLQEELNSISPDPAEVREEPLSPDGSLVRLNLRSFKARRGDTENLLRAMFRTAATFTSSRERLRAYWGEIVHLAGEHRIPFAPDTLRAYFTAQEEHGFPAVHHSSLFVNTYHPAYRIVLKQYLSNDHRKH